MAEFVNRTGATSAKDMIFVSIDVDTLDEAKRMMDQLGDGVSNVKFGLQLATREGWAAVIAAGRERGFKVFADSKFKDIPNTVEHAAAAMTQHQPEYFTIMADNSLDALKGVRRGVDDRAAELRLEQKPKVIGVTVLTSIDADECLHLYGADAATKVRQFGDNAVAAGLDAIVCSPDEVGLFRAESAFNQTILITPGVRPIWAASNDQSRAATPAEAIRRGADMLVIGRPITQPPADISSPKDAIQRIINEIEEAMA